MASALLNTVYTAAALIVAVAGAAAVMWITPSTGGTDRQGRLSGTLTAIAVAVFVVATGALLLV